MFDDICPYQEPIHRAALTAPGACRLEGAASPEGPVVWSPGPPILVVSNNRGTPKWMVYTGKAYLNGRFGGTPILGNPHLELLCTSYRLVRPFFFKES